MYGSFSGGLIGRLKGVPHPKIMPHFSSLRIITLDLATRRLDVSDRGGLFSELGRCGTSVPGLVSQHRFGSEQGFATRLYRGVHGHVTSGVSNTRRCFYVSSGPVRIYHLSENLHYGVGKASMAGSPTFNCYTARGVCCFKCGLRTIYKLDKIVRSCSLDPTGIRSVRFLGSMGFRFRSYYVLNSQTCLDTRLRRSLFSSMNVGLRIPCHLGVGG